LSGNLLDQLFSPAQQRVADALSKWKDRTVAEVGETGLMVARQPPSPWLTSPADESSAVARPAKESGAPVPQPLPMPGLAVDPGPRQPSDRLRFAELRPVGQVHRTYLVCESPDGLVLLDQHAAHERVLYERLREKRAGEAARGQPLLVPVTLEMSPADARLVESVLEELADLGFEVEPFGGNTLSVKAAPAELEGSDWGEVLRQLAGEVRQFGRAHSAEAMEEALLARMACHTAVRKGASMTPEEIQSLLKQLDGTPFAAQCPHGRPVAVRFDVNALKEMFARTYEGRPRPSLQSDGRI